MDKLKGMGLLAVGAAIGVAAKVLFDHVVIMEIEDEDEYDDYEDVHAHEGDRACRCGGSHEGDCACGASEAAGVDCAGTAAGDAAMSDSKKANPTADVEGDSDGAE